MHYYHLLAAALHAKACGWGCQFKAGLHAGWHGHAPPGGWNVTALTAWGLLAFAVTFMLLGRRGGHR